LIQADLADASRDYENVLEGLGVRFLEKAHTFILTLTDFPAKYALYHHDTRIARMPHFP
jgi:hypothetical protein